MEAGRAGPAPEEADPDIIPHDQLRKYIAYAKQSCRPKLQNADYDKIAQVPLKRPLTPCITSAKHMNSCPSSQEQLIAHIVTACRRQERLHIHYARRSNPSHILHKNCISDAQVYAELRRESAVSQGMPIAVRHLESIIRMSEAHAAMHLREYVNEQDVDTAIRYTPSRALASMASHARCMPTFTACTARAQHITGQSHRCDSCMMHAPEAVRWIHCSG